MAWLEKRDGVWFITYRDSGKVRRVRASSDKLVARARLGKFLTAQARGEDYSDPFKDHRGRSIEQHLKDYIADLQALGRDSAYIYRVGKRLERLTTACGWKRLSDITADSFCAWRETPTKQRSAQSEDRTIGPVTLNQHLEAARAFCRWCVKRKRAASNPLADIEKADQTADVRRARRALSEEDLTRLLAAVDERHQLAYRMILATGLRRAELAQLCWGDVHLDSPTSFILLRAETTKAGRADTLPIRADLAERLVNAQGQAGDDDPVCPSLPTIIRHRLYLEAASIAWEDGDRRRADFHALRHTYGTMLSKAGVTPREAMSLMRHSDMRLTMRTYTDPRVLDLSGAVEKLPAMASKSPGGKSGSAPRDFG